MTEGVMQHMKCLSLAARHPLQQLCQDARMVSYQRTSCLLLLTSPLLQHAVPSDGVWFVTTLLANYKTGNSEVAPVTALGNCS